MPENSPLPFTADFQEALGDKVNEKDSPVNGESKIGVEGRNENDYVEMV